MALRGHFAKFAGVRTTSKHASVTPTYMEKMIVREPQLNEKNLHPAAKRKWNAMMQEPRPLAFKLHEWPVPQVQAKMEAAERLNMEDLMDDLVSIPEVDEVVVVRNAPVDDGADIPF